MAEGTAAAYRALIASRVRSQAGYRTSFALDLWSAALVGLVEFAEIWVIFGHVPELGGLDLAAAALVYALANIAFGLAELFTGNLTRLPLYIRAGTLDVLLLRPLPVLAQLMTDDLAVRRLGRVTTGLAILAVALPGAGVDWSPARVALLAGTPLAGAVIFGALFVVAGAVQFWLVEGGEFTSAFTYGGEYAASLPGGVMPLPLRVLFTFVLPATFVGYLPALALLGRDGPAGTPGWLGWWLPVAAAVAWLAALALWRTGLRRYTGAGG